MNRVSLRVLSAIFGLIVLLSSCNIGDDGLGSDVLPPGDIAEVYHDTVFEFDAYAVSGQPLVTSEVYYSANRLMLVGSLVDSIVGKSEGSVMTQFNATATYRVGTNLEIDSLYLALYINDFVGDLEQELNLSLYEFTERLYIDSVYYSDFDAEGKYNPVPLAQMTITPEANQSYNLLIEDQAFIDKFLAVQADTTVFYNDSIFKDYFNGFYITAEAVSSEGTMARIQVASPLSSLTMRYANDSTDVDSTAERDFAYAYFSIDEYAAQKINLLEHDYSGTYLGEIIDDENAISPYSYVQGIGGVNTRYSFAGLQEWMDQAPIIINSAILVFDVVPEEESGILYDDLPSRMMISTLLEDNSLEQIYDYNVLWYSDPTKQASRFGGYLKADSQGMFSDTTYNYRFNMGLHFQSMVDGEKTDNDFLIQVADGLVNPQFSKLWSNLPTNQQRIRLELVYLKL